MFGTDAYSWWVGNENPSRNPAAVRGCSILDPGTLRLVASKKLHRILIRLAAHPESFDEPIIEPLKSMSNLSMLNHLRSLEIYNIPTVREGNDKDMEYLTYGLIKSFVISPRLKVLGLGFDRSVIDDLGIPETELYQGLQVWHFLQTLCNRYGDSEKAPRPLALKTLKLGCGMFLENVEARRYLPKLLNLQSLQTVHLWAGSTTFGAHQPRRVYRYQPDMPVFDESTRLSQLCIPELTDPMVQWLKTSGKTVQELIIAPDSDYVGRPDLRDWYDIPAGQLKMLFYRDHRAVPTLPSYAAQAYLQNGFSEQDLERHRTTTILDRMLPEGNILERLCLSLNFQTQWVRKFYRLAPFCHLHQHHSLPL